MIRALGSFGIFTWRVLHATATHKVPVREVVHEGYRIGVRSLPVLVIISVFVGTNLAIQGYAVMRSMGAQHMVGMFVALGGMREMAPIMVAAMVAAKAGTEMASQLALMRIRQQIDALEVMAINPYWVLVTPRLLGIFLVLPPLLMISDFALLGAGGVVSVLQLGISATDYLYYAVSVVSIADLGFGVIKAAVFAAVISLVSTWFGFHAKDGATGVGRATNGAVVVSAVVCAILNYGLSELFFG